MVNPVKLILGCGFRLLKNLDSVKDIAFIISKFEKALYRIRDITGLLNKVLFLLTQNLIIRVVFYKPFNQNNKCHGDEKHRSQNALPFWHFQVQMVVDFNLQLRRWCTILFIFFLFFGTGAFEKVIRPLTIYINLNIAEF